jgi:hypothetical protein
MSRARIRVRLRENRRPPVGAALFGANVKLVSCASGIAAVCGRVLRDDVDESGAAEVHRLVQRHAQVLWVLDKEALAADRFHRPVVARALDQRVGPHLEQLQPPVSNVISSACRLFAR